jgi:hypothetical protein
MGLVAIDRHARGRSIRRLGDDIERLGDASRLVRCLPAGLVNQPSVGTGTPMRPASAA